MSKARIAMTTFIYIKYIKNKSRKYKYNFIQQVPVSP